MAQLRPAVILPPRDEGHAKTPLFQLLRPALPTVVHVQEPRRLLHPGPFAKQPDVLSLSFVDGTVAGCREGDEVRLVANAAELLAAELRALPRLPRAVLLSPSTDPFPPLNEVQHTTVRLVEVLARHGIDAWLMTRGYIRPAALDALCRHTEHVKVTVALTTLDRPLQRLLEPLSAPPRLRLRTLRSLVEAGIAAQAALDPLIPGVTDTREHLLPLLEAIAATGVSQIAVGYLVLHPRTENDLLAKLRPLGLDAMVGDEYARGPLLTRGRSPAGRYLPRSRRQHGYAALMAMAANFGLRVSVNALTNPDFSPAPPVARSVVDQPAVHLN